MASTNLKSLRVVLSSCVPCLLRPGTMVRAQDTLSRTGAEPSTTEIPPKAEAYGHVNELTEQGATVFIFSVAGLAEDLFPSMMCSNHREDESVLRKLFATDKTHPRLDDIHVGLIDLLAAPGDVCSRTTSMVLL
ncbi:hypothetical protein EVG20_g9432 [Dentipellis fragilis]|uniref:Uncharacterized protein n=1 Tax=Dentipellis fragilis TaxID=205917 RepID=A0A4Y9XYF2_9AGAM|nr:hypothetical protein EVG20_g9432 [Dentipellis fragilis]